MSIHTKNTVSTAAEIAKNARQMVNREKRGRNLGGVRRDHHELSDTEGRSLALSSDKPYGGKAGLMIKTA